MSDQMISHSLLKRIILEKQEIIKRWKILDRDLSFEQNANYLISGPRRSGKTTLLYQRARSLVEDGRDWKQIIYVSFDDERLFGFSLNDFDDILEVSS